MYSKKDFTEILASLRGTLKTDTGDALCCKLHECGNAPGAVEIEYADGSTDLHVAEACNVAAVIESLDRILSLPRSTVACQELSEVMLLRLDVVREYVRSLLPEADYQEADAEALIRWWAGFLKHPGGFVLAHRCFGDVSMIEGALRLDKDAITTFGQMGSHDKKDRVKKSYENLPVEVVLPTILEIDEFFKACRNHIEKALNIYV